MYFNKNKPLLQSYQNKNVTARNPAINRMIKITERMLKYLKTKRLIRVPKRLMSHAMAKNLIPRPTTDAANICQIETLKSPTAIVKTLKGIKVKAAVKTVRKAFDLKAAPSESMAPVK